MQRHPDLWDPCGSAPFCLEKAAGRDRWQYIPFSACPYSCIGAHCAMLEAILALATIIRRTGIRSLSDDLGVALTLTMVAAAVLAVVKAHTGSTQRSA